ncbi:Hsp20/alpha crystallin family protein [Streptomyces sp. NPDC056227]|uniref:Hsp20/alpha crystallin family protein n=1 Tax=Streptomyces sp. NPDC056227 TaxID=3345753 RepID=UPI0035DF728A
MDRESRDDDGGHPPRFTGKEGAGRPPQRPVGPKRECALPGEIEDGHRWWRWRPRGAGSGARDVRNADGAETRPLPRSHGLVRRRLPPVPGVAADHRRSPDPERGERRGRAWALRAELPGMDPEKEIRTPVEGNTLAIGAEHTGSKTEQEHSELRHGSFRRTVRLPAESPPEDVEEACEDGILTVRVPLQPAGGGVHPARERAGVKTSALFRGPDQSSSPGCRTRRCVRGRRRHRAEA